MASRYRKKFALPEDFMDILEAYSREVLRDQPLDIIEFSYLYFKALEEVSRPAPLPDERPRSEFCNSQLFSREHLSNSTTQRRDRTSHLTRQAGLRLRTRVKRKAKKRVTSKVTTTRTGTE